MVGDNSFYETEGQGKGTFIKNPDTAHDLADTEANRGQNARIKQEKELLEKHQLREEAKVGETTPGKMKAEFIDYLFEKYPKAFEKVTDDKERDALVYTPSYDRYTLPTPLLITRYGMVQFNNLSIGLPGSEDQIALMKKSLGQITDVLKEGGGNMTYLFGVDGAVLKKLDPLMGNTGRYAIDLTLNFSNKCPRIVNMDVRDQNLKNEADKIFGWTQGQKH